jgi:hypothetical protein
MEQHAAADDGDVRFFELAYLEAEIKQAKKLIVHVTLKDFVIPNTELIPEEVREVVGLVPRHNPSSTKKGQFHMSVLA